MNCLPSEIINLIVDFLPQYELLSCIPEEKINWGIMSKNPRAIDLLKEHPDKIDWYRLSSNPGAIDLLKDNFDNIYWWNLSSNPAAANLLKAHPYKVTWDRVVKCEPTFALDVLEAYPYKTSAWYQMRHSIATRDTHLFSRKRWEYGSASAHLKLEKEKIFSLFAENKMPGYFFGHPDIFEPVDKQFIFELLYSLNW